MHLAIRYVSLFRYPEPAWDSHNVLRACPISDDHQRLIDYRLDVEPRPSIASHIDAWGTRVDTFAVRDPHRELRVIARSEVETSAAARSRRSTALSAPLAAYRARPGVPRRPLGLAPAHAPHPLGRPDRGAGRARDRRARGSVGDVDRRAWTARPTRRSPTSRARRTWARRWRPCSRAARACARTSCTWRCRCIASVGIPARYVSGYFYARGRGRAALRPRPRRSRSRRTPGWRSPCPAGAGGRSTPRTCCPPASAT